MPPSPQPPRHWPRLFPALALATAVAAAAGGFACADSCLQIQNTLCYCRGRTTDEINACETTASTQESLAPPTSAQLATCASLAQECSNVIDGGTNCEILQTQAGRQICGIENDPDAGS